MVIASNMPRGPAIRPEIAPIASGDAASASALTMPSSARTRERNAGGARLCSTTGISEEDATPSEPWNAAKQKAWNGDGGGGRSESGRRGGRGRVGTDGGK